MIHFLFEPDVGKLTDIRYALLACVSVLQPQQLSGALLLSGCARFPAETLGTPAKVQEECPHTQRQTKTIP